MSDKIRVLIVDDDPLHLSMVQRLLGSYGFEVEASESALGVSNTIRHSNPDVVLLDVNIPDLSGDQVLQIARRHAAPGTQFVLYSANDESRLKQLAETVSADGWISKSAEPEQLVKRLQEHARKRRAHT